MKRHHFACLEATHGVSVSHRSHGSTGQRQDPGRIFGEMQENGRAIWARVRVTVTQNLKIIQVDEEQGVIPDDQGGSIPGGRKMASYWSRTR